MDEKKETINNVVTDSKSKDPYEKLLSIITNYDEIQKTIVSRVFSDLRVRKEPSEVVDTVNRIIRMINKYNSLSEDDEVVRFSGGNVRHISEVKVPHEFSFLIIPLSIRLDPRDRKTTDLKVVPKFSCSKVNDVTYNEYLDDIHRFRSYFRRDGIDELDVLSDLRKHVSLFDVINKLCVVDSKGVVSESSLLDARVTYMGEHFWPYFVSNQVKVLFRDSYFNATFRELSLDYLSNIHFAK